MWDSATVPMNKNARKLFNIALQYSTDTANRKKIYIAKTSLMTQLSAVNMHAGPPLVLAVFTETTR